MLGSDYVIDDENGGPPGLPQLFKRYRLKGRAAVTAGDGLQTFGGWRGDIRTDGQSAVDDHRLPRHPLRFIAGEEQNHVGDIFWFANSRNRLRMTERTAGSSIPGIAPQIGVLITPGQMQLTRIRSRPSCSAAARVRLITAPLDAAYDAPYVDWLSRRSTYFLGDPFGSDLRVLA